MIDTRKYEGHTPGPWDYDSEGQRVDINADDDLTYEVICSKVLTDADGSLIADAPLFLAEVKRMQYWDEEMDRVIAHLAQHNWASSDGDVHEIVEYTLAEVKRLRKENELMVTYLRYMRDGELTDKDWLSINDLIGEEE